MNTKEELVISALRERIGTLVTDYELQIASLRADYTQLIDQVNTLKSELEELQKDQEKEVSNEEAVPSKRKA